jgi:GAF domain-containing protein
MTVQSAKAAAFDESSTEALQAMADQVAVAIDNARRFSNAQAAVLELEAAQQRYLGQAWAEFARGRRLRGYARTQSGILELGAQILPEVRQAVSARRPIIGRGRSVRAQSADDKGPSASSALVAPVLYRGQPIGALGVRDVEGSRQWSEADIELVQAVGEQFAQAAENLRLIENTQQREAVERVTREITDDIRAAVSIEDAVRRTLHALGRALGEPELMAQLGSEQTLLDSAPDVEGKGEDRG